MNPRILLPLSFALTLALSATPAFSHAQQAADPSFRPSLARPAFKSGEARVLFDEAHHNFHTLEGRYHPFAELLRLDGCQLTPNREQFTPQSLTTFNLLVIANAAGDDLAGGSETSAARPAFTPDEIEAVHGWVQSGGALLLIADHAPFGQAAAALAERFGVDMAKGYTLDKVQTFGGEGDPADIEFTRERGSLGEHAIFLGRDNSERVARIVAFTGQSLAGPHGSSALLLLSSSALDLPPMSPDRPEDPDAVLRQARSAAGRSLGVAMNVGSGRVVVLGEAAMLTAQVVSPRGGGPARKTGMGVEGIDNQQFVLNTVRWLGGALVAARNTLMEPPAAENPPTVSRPGFKPPGSPAAEPDASSIKRAGQRPDFSGTWKLVDQETKAWRGRGTIGNYEEPVRITQSDTRLLIEVQTSDPNGIVEYVMAAPAGPRPEPTENQSWSVSEWDGSTLITTGRRAFTTKQGSQMFPFKETRKFSPDGRRMLVEIRIVMQPSDLVRKSQFERIP